MEAARGALSKRQGSGAGYGCAYGPTYDRAYARLSAARRPGGFGPERSRLRETDENIPTPVEPRPAGSRDRMRGERLRG